MIAWMVAWRAELLTGMALLVSWLAIPKLFHQSFIRLWLPGLLLGLTIEVMTEPNWTYSVQCYLWRHISVAVVTGWGILFAWLVVISDFIYARWLARSVPGTKPGPAILLTDVLIGMPLFLMNEIFGLHILKIWRYNPILHWDTIIPVIQYPLEGLATLFLFVLTVPAVIRWWKGY
jgi:hypothetical protein